MQRVAPHHPRVLPSCAGRPLKLASVICQAAWRSVVRCQCVNQTNSRCSPRLRNQKSDVECITVQAAVASSHPLYRTIASNTSQFSRRNRHLSRRTLWSPNIRWRRPTTPGSSSQLFHIKLQTCHCVHQRSVWRSDRPTVSSRRTRLMTWVKTFIFRQAILIQPGSNWVSTRGKSSGSFIWCSASK